MLEDIEKNHFIISTGSDAADLLLDGGIRTKETYEILGLPGVGKT